MPGVYVTGCSRWFLFSATRLLPPVVPVLQRASRGTTGFDCVLYAVAIRVSRVLTHSCGCYAVPSQQSCTTLAAAYRFCLVARRAHFIAVVRAVAAATAANSGTGWLQLYRGLHTCVPGYHHAATSLSRDNAFYGFHFYRAPPTADLVPHRVPAPHTRSHTPLVWTCCHLTVTVSSPDLSRNSWHSAAVTLQTGSLRREHGCHVAVPLGFSVLALVTRAMLRSVRSLRALPRGYFCHAPLTVLRACVWFPHLLPLNICRCLVALVLRTRTPFLPSLDILCRLLLVTGSAFVYGCNALRCRLPLPAFFWLLAARLPLPAGLRRADTLRLPTSPHHALSFSLTSRSCGLHLARPAFYSPPLPTTRLPRCSSATFTTISVGYRYAVAASFAALAATHARFRVTNAASAV